MRKICALLICMTGVAASGWAQAKYNSIPDPGAVVTAGNARFTVLTPRVVRMEWSRDGEFEDLASLTFVNRRLPVPHFETSSQNGVLRLRTDSLELTYDSSAGAFNTDNLKIVFRDVQGKDYVWYPGLKNEGNLLGTARTLDGYDGAVKRKWGGEEVGRLKMDEGLISRDGWMVFDDSSTPVFDDSDWAWVQAREQQGQDLYFFGYGLDYKTALKDFTAVAGHIPMPPKFAFGVWWSRYWAYTDVQYKDLVDEYRRQHLPLDVLVIDMDWHITNRADWWKNGKPTIKGWTGFTWEKIYFPDPEGFLKWTDEAGVQTCLNLHPADGIRSYESMYEPFAKAMDIDPATGKTVPFNITDKQYAENYFKYVIHPMEAQGVDFWWLDWQQGGKTAIPGVNPTFYLNYVHFSEMQRQGKRPLIFHRYGGLGNHRYQIGFSGDTWADWDSLAFQPYFTANAANVGYGYWSHDIGGHMYSRENNPELYTRWIQWGVFSPIFRTHGSKQPGHERRMWLYPFEYFEVMRSAMQMRYEMFPYIYSASRKAYETGVSIVHPMYYDYPDEENAYQFTGQYMFGDDILVSPVTKPIDANRLYTMQKVWLPEGQWIESCTGSVLDGGQVVERPYRISEIPVFMRAGAVIPMQAMPEYGLAQIGNRSLGDLILNVYPGADGETVVYDDEGGNENYITGSYSKTRISSAVRGNTRKVTIHPAEGSFPGMSEKRGWTVRFNLVYPPQSVKIDGKNAEWTYDGQELTLQVQTGEKNVHQPVNIEVSLPSNDAGLLSGKPGMFKRLFEIDQHTTQYRKDWDYQKSGLFIQDIARAVQTGRRITLNPDPDFAERELKELDKSLPAIDEALKGFVSPKGEHRQILDLFENAVVPAASAVQ